MKINIKKIGLVIILFAVSTNAQTGSVQWIPLVYNMDNGSCTSITDCDNNVMCFGLEYTPGYTGEFTSYTSGWFVSCTSDGNAVISNESCVMVDNSEINDYCTGFGITYMASSGNTGVILVTEGVPIVIHQVCFSVPSGEEITITEDVPPGLDITASIITVAGAVTDFPVYNDQTLNVNLDCPLPVELSSFTANANLTGVQLDWTTESETENLGFIIERKSEESAWEEIASYKTVEEMLGQGTINSATDYFFTDVLVEGGVTYKYRLADVDYHGIITYHSVREVDVVMDPLSAVVEEFTVLPAYPNPFNPTTTIRYGLDEDSNVNIQIYDITGRLTTTLVNKEETMGWHAITWNGKNQHGEKVPAGIYLSRVIAGSNVKTSKLLLLK